MDRLIRAKKPYAVAAAAMLLLGTGGFALGSGLELKSVSDPSIKKGTRSRQVRGTAYSGQESKFNQKKTEAESTQKEVKTIIAGQEERLNWPRFFEIESAAMPRPGDPKKGGNLDRSIWVGAGNVGIDALDWFNRRMRTAFPSSRPWRTTAPSTRRTWPSSTSRPSTRGWVTDIGGFLEAADNQVFDAFGDKIADAMKDDEREMDEAKGRFKPKKVEGAGWVVEIRGYTDHKAARSSSRTLCSRTCRTIDRFEAAKDDKKIGKYIVGVADPVKGKVSHAFIYKVWRRTRPAQLVREHHRLDARQDPRRQFGQHESLRRVLRSARRGPVWDGNRLELGRPYDGHDHNGFPGASLDRINRRRDLWRQLDGKRRWSAPSGGMSAGGLTMSVGKLSGGSGVGPPGLPGTVGGASKETFSKDDRRRFEFVVMLVWREPVPKIEPNADTGTTGQYAPESR